MSDKLKEEIDSRFNQEKEILKYEVDKPKHRSMLSYVRPIFFISLLLITMIGLSINLVGVISYFMKH